MQCGEQREVGTVTLGEEYQSTNLRLLLVIGGVCERCL